MNNLITQLFTSLSADSNFWSGIIGALVGAIIGGLISYFIQRAAFKEAGKIRASELLLAQKTTATSIFFKVARMHGNCSSIVGTMRQCFAIPSNENVEPWQFVPPFVAVPPEVHFLTEEQTMLFGFKDNNVFESVIDLDVAHNYLMRIIYEFSEERKSIENVLKPDAFRGNIGSSDLDQETYNRLRPKMLAANQLIDQIKSQSEKVKSEALSAMSSLSHLFKVRLDHTIKFELRPKV